MTTASKRILVCGGRDYDDRRRIRQVLTGLRTEYGPFTLIHGSGRGADLLADVEAGLLGLPRSAFFADWKTHGRAAGPIRNQAMLDDGKPDLVVAFPGGRGTADMKRRARLAGVEVAEIDA